MVTVSRKAGGGLNPVVTVSKDNCFAEQQHLCDYHRHNVCLFFPPRSKQLKLKLFAFVLAAKLSRQGETPFKHVCTTRKTQFSNGSQRGFPFARDLRRPTQTQSAVEQRKPDRPVRGPRRPFLVTLGMQFCAMVPWFAAPTWSNGCQRGVFKHPVQISFLFVAEFFLSTKFLFFCR